MRCEVCGSDLFDEENCECPVCGFESPAVAGTVEPDKLADLMKKYVDRYRSARRQGIVIGIKIISYWKDGNGKLEKDRETVVLLSPEESSGADGRIWWHDMRFITVPPGRKMQLQLIVKDPSGKETERAVSMTAPDWGETSWKIGFLEEEKLHFCIVLGTDDDGGRLLKSEPVSMIYA